MEVRGRVMEVVIRGELRLPMGKCWQSRAMELICMRGEVEAVKRRAAACWIGKG